MSYEAAWLLLSFAIMVVAVLVNVHEKLERLEEQGHPLFDAYYNCISAP